MKTFILGLGSQKCGTTAITGLLKKARVKFPFGNEAHILNKSFKPRYNFSKSAGKGKNKLFIDPWEYAQIFNKHSGEERFVGDFTPAYCTLSIAELAYTRKILKEEGFKIKTIFIARDPFKRCWSAARMNLGNNYLNEGGSIKAAHKWFKKQMLSERYQARTKYEEVITNIEKSFERDEIYIGIFEQIFSGNILHNLNPLFKYLELDPPTKLVKAKESSELKLAEPIQHKKIFQKHYKNTYEFMGEKFPITREFWGMPE